MKKYLLLLVLFIGLCHSAFAAGEEPDAPTDRVAALQRALEQWTAKLAERLQAVEESLANVKERLGESFGRPSVFNNIEQRLKDMEERLDDLEKEVERLEDRVRRVERN